MREIRTFEMEQDEPATVWQIARPVAVTVTAGQLWLTVEHDAEDYWLVAGQSFVLPAGVRAWISAGRGRARVTVRKDADSRAPSAAVALRLRTWMPRWLRVA